MRGFGRTERVPLDATRGLRDWSDDVHALVRALGVDAPLHLAGWSTGGAAVSCYAIDRPVASLTLIDPVSPYGFGGCHLDGTPCAPDWAGTGGGGGGNPEFTARIVSGDRSAESPFSPRSVLNSAYWTPTHREPPEREDALVDEILLSQTGEDGYPGGLRALAALAGLRAGNPRDLERTVRALLRLVGPGGRRPAAAGAVDARLGRHRHRRRLALGDGRAGPDGRCAGMAR